MDAIDYKLRPYTSNLITLQKQQKNVFYYNLLVDVSKFSHPGTNKILQKHYGEDVANLFIKNNHSLNARITVCFKIVGRTDNPQKQKDGQLFYQALINDYKFKKHQQIMEKCDFSKPIFTNFENLSFEEIQLLTQIPKYFKQPKKVKFYSENQDYTNKMDESLKCVWLFLALFIGVWIFQLFLHCFELFSLVYLIIGYLAGSLVEYLLHKYQFHQDIVKNKRFQGPDSHHMFPNVQYFMPIRLTSVNHYLIAALVVSYFFLQQSTIIYLILGVFLMMILLNWVHWMSHLDIQFGNGVIDALKLNHINHHLKNQHSRYGISCTLWDYIFFTRT